MKGIKTLSLSGTLITTNILILTALGNKIDSVVPFSKLISLQKLDLSFNTITSLDGINVAMIHRKFAKLILSGDRESNVSGPEQQLYHIQFFIYIISTPKTRSGDIGI